MSNGAPPSYWFARRFPVGHPSKAMAPVHWKGYAVTGAYVSLLTAGGLAFAWLGASGRIIEGAVLFILAAAIGAGGYITIAARTCDQTRTVADYRKERARA